MLPKNHTLQENLDTGRESQVNSNTNAVKSAETVGPTPVLNKSPVE